MPLPHLHGSEIVPGLNQVWIGTEHMPIDLLRGRQFPLILELDGTLEFILKGTRTGGLETQQRKDEQGLHCTTLKSAAASVYSPLSWSSKVRTRR